MPRRGSGVPSKKPIPNVKKVIAVSSGKGGVGKSTVAVNLALGLAATSTEVLKRKARVGLLDLDIYGPSLPKLMHLEDLGEPELTQRTRLAYHRRSIDPYDQLFGAMYVDGILVAPASSGSNADTPVVWRGLMVMKAVQQLLFDVDWRAGVSPETNDSSTGLPELDVLVIDMPPGTGDVALSLSQLVMVDGAVVVSTPQDVALIDARKGITMFNKVNVPILGLVLNMSHFLAPDTGMTYPIFGSSENFDQLASRLQTAVLGKIPLEMHVSQGGDTGVPEVIRPQSRSISPKEAQTSHEVFRQIAKRTWERLQNTSKTQ